MAGRMTRTKPSISLAYRLVLLKLSILVHYDGIWANASVAANTNFGRINARLELTYDLRQSARFGECGTGYCQRSIALIIFASLRAVGVALETAHGAWFCCMSRHRRLLSRIGRAGQARLGQNGPTNIKSSLSQARMRRTTLAASVAWPLR